MTVNKTQNEEGFTRSMTAVKTIDLKSANKRGEKSVNESLYDLNQTIQERKSEKKQLLERERTQKIGTIEKSESSDAYFK